MDQDNIQQPGIELDKSTHGYTIGLWAGVFFLALAFLYFAISVGLIPTVLEISTPPPLNL